MINLNFAKQLALCFALPGSAWILYLIWKQSKDKEELVNYSLVTRQSKNEIKVPVDCVGSIIGTEGSVIKDIQKNTNTKIAFKRQEESESQRTLIIRGTNANIQKAEFEIKRLISEKPIFLTDTIEVPQEQCGRIIGRNGANINMIRKLSGCRVTVGKEALKNSNNNRIYNTITLNGSIEQISHAKELIRENIKEDVERKKSTSKLNNSNSNQSWKSRENSTDIISFDFATKKPSTVKFPITDNDVAVYVSAVANPTAFWVHIVDEETIKLDALVDKMQEFYEKNASDQRLFVNNFQIGDIFAATFNGSGWYRVEIKGTVAENIEETIVSEKYNKLNDTNELIDIYYVDFGDSAYVRKTALRKLLSKFNELPCQAILASLNDVQPTNSFWAEKDISYFEDITYSCQWKQLTAKFRHLKHDQETVVLDLIDPTKEVDITEKLIESGHASRTINEPNTITHQF